MTMLSQRETTAEQIVARVVELAPQFHSRTAETEARRTVDQRSIAELLDAGVARMMVPAEYGGLDGRIRDLVAVTSAAARGCPSTGWLTGLMCAVSRTFALFPREAQDAVWADGPDVIGAASIGLAATPTTGGYHVTGSSPFSSGVNNATWVYIIGTVTQPGGGKPEMRLFLIPRSDFEIRDVWQTVGMRGTGSNTVITENVFVPESFTISQVDAREGTTPGAQINGNPGLSLPWSTTGSLSFAATMLGATEAAYEEVVGILRTKRTPSGLRTAESEVLQTQIAAAAARLAAAGHTLYRLADRADVSSTFSVEERVAGLRDMAFASTLFKDAVDILMEISGTSGFALSTTAQQAWRDIHFAAAHQGLSTRTFGALFGQLELGVEASRPMFY